MIDLIHEIAQTMRTNKLRTVLTGVAVTWGVFMLIILLGVARGVTNNFESNVTSGQNAMLTIYGGTTTIPYKGNREGRRIRLDEHDLVSIPEKNRHYTDEVTARLYGDGNLTTSRGSFSESYWGVFPSEKKELISDKLEQGRFINDRDMQTASKVIVLSSQATEILFPPDGKGALGSIVECNGLPFLVVGVYRHQYRRTPFIPFTTARAISSDKDDFGNLSVRLVNVTDEKDGETAESDVRATLAANHKFSPDDTNAVYISNYFTNSLQAGKGLVILNTSVWILGILTMLTGIVGISNIMFVTVRERTHEIGIRRAIGAKPVKILTQVIAESVAITLTFGYAGIVMGMAVTQVIDHFAGNGRPFLNPTVDISIAVEVTCVLVAAGALAGLFPALKALKVKPVEALRDE